MKIVLVARPTTLDYLVPLFESEGHEAYLFTGLERNLPGTLRYTDKEYVESCINILKPDYVVNAIPGLILESEYKVLQNTKESSDLEMKRYETKYKSLDYGFKEIQLLDEHATEFIQTRNEVQYVKPKEGDLEVLKLEANTSFDEIKDDVVFVETPYYVEQELDYDVEAWCFFTIANGKYSIIRHIGGTGCGESKLVNNRKYINDVISDWRQGITLQDLTDDQETVFIEACTKWLDYIVTLGGNYEGCIGGYIKGDDVYWSEQNSRPGMQNIGMLPGTAMNWLEGLESDPSKSVNQISASTIRSEKGWG